MEIITYKVTKDIVITKDTQFNDLQCENVTVAENITTRIYGIINQDLIVEKNAIVYLHGKVLGEIINNGGTVYGFGPSGKITTY